MFESALITRLVDFSQLIDIAGLRRNSHREVTPSCRRQHIGKCETLFLTVPWSRVRRQLSCADELPYEPEDYKGVAPLNKHWRVYNRKLSTALGFCGSQELFNLTIGHLDALLGPVSLNNFARLSPDICVEKHYGAVTFSALETANGSTL